MAATAALCFAGGSFANDVAGGDNASDSSEGFVTKTKIVAGAVGIGILGAVIANNRGNTTVTPVRPIEPEDPADPVCGPGEELVDGECTPVVTPPPVTTTVTTSVTTSVTTPVTITATSTTL